jgi:hypothetical protein
MRSGAGQTPIATGPHVMPACRNRRAVGFPKQETKLTAFPRVGRCYGWQFRARFLPLRERELEQPCEAPG